MGDQHQSHGVLVTQARQQRQDAALRGNIQGRRRFVGDEDARLRVECCRNGDALAHAARQFVGVRASDTCVEADVREKRACALGSFRATAGARGRDLLAARQRRCQRGEGILREPDDATTALLLQARLVRRQVVVVPAQRHRAAGRQGRRRKRTQRPRKHRLSRTGLAHDDEGAPGAGMHADIVDDHSSAAVGDAHMRGHEAGAAVTYRRGAHRSRSLRSANQSPAMLIAVAVTMMERPAATDAAGFWARRARPSASWRPQSASCAPTPRPR